MAIINVNITDEGLLIHVQSCLNGHGCFPFKIKLPVFYLGTDTIFLLIVAIKEKIDLTVEVACNSSKDLERPVLAE
jgi:hypothetical protein